MYIRVVPAAITQARTSGPTNITMTHLGTCTCSFIVTYNPQHRLHLLMYCIVARGARKLLVSFLADVLPPARSGNVAFGRYPRLKRLARPECVVVHTQARVVLYVVQGSLLACLIASIVG